MEAATPLRQPHVRTIGDRLVVDGLVVQDECAVRLVREREEAGEDPARVVADAIEIGARILDREQAGATVELLRQDLQRASREVETQLGQTSAAVVTELRTRLEEAFGAESGQVSRVLARHFGADSSTAVQHQVRTAVAELLTEQRERLFRQFSTADESNPLAAFQRHAVAAIRQSSDQQHAHLRQMQGTIEELRLEVAKLQSEKVRREEVAAEHDRSTAKGRPYEEAVFDAVDAIAHGQGDDCDAVGDMPGVGGRKGDVLVGIDGCSGPPRARIVFEAKNSQIPRKRALAELDEAMAQRDAAYGVWVVRADDKLPARTQPLHEINGDKVFVVYDPEDRPTALELVFRLARARALMARGEADGLDASALRAEVERALGTMEEVRRIKQQLTHAADGVETAPENVESLDRRIRAHLTQI